MFLVFVVAQLPLQSLWYILGTYVSRCLYTVEYSFNNVNNDSPLAILNLKKSSPSQKTSHFVLWYWASYMTARDNEKFTF